MQLSVIQKLHRLEEYIPGMLIFVYIMPWARENLFLLSLVRSVGLTMVNRDSNLVYSEKSTKSHEELSQKLTSVVRQSKSGIPYGSMPWARNKAVACVIDVFDVGSAVVSFEQRSEIKITKSFPFLYFGSGLSTFKAITFRWPDADNSCMYLPCFRLLAMTCTCCTFLYRLVNFIVMCAKKNSFSYSVTHASLTWVSNN